MNITQVEAFPVPPRWAFCRIETDEGVTGWGECTLEGHAATQVAAVGELARILVGEDPTRIEFLWQSMYRAGFYRGGPRPHERAQRRRYGPVGHSRQSAWRARL